MPRGTSVSVDRDLADLIPDFFAHRKEELEQARRALTRGDLATVRRVAHGLKGVGGAYGFDYVSEIGVALQRAAADADAQAIQRLLAELADYLAQVRVNYV